MTNRRMSEIIATGPGILPSNQSAGSQSTAAFTLDKARKALFTVLAGAGGGTVAFKLQASATLGGTYADVPGAASTPLAAAGIAQLEIAADRINALGAGPYFKGVLTVSGSTTQTAVVAQLGDARYQPASDYNDAGVALAVVI